MQNGVLKNIFKKNIFDPELRQPKGSTEVGVPEERLNLDILPDNQFYSYGYSSVNMESDEYTMLINRWRKLARIPEVEDAVDEIVNEACSMDDGDIIKLSWAESHEIQDAQREQIEDEWDVIRKLLKLGQNLDELFRQAYQDGALYIEDVYDKNDLTKGIMKLNLLAPHRVRLFYGNGKRQYLYDPSPTEKKARTFAAPFDRDHNMYVFDDTTMTFVSCGPWNEDKTIPLSYLDKSVKPANQLAMMEDAVVIYRIVRAPERRAFYIDVGRMPKTQAEEYIKRLSDRYRNSRVYDTNTGEIVSKKAAMSAIEDFWLPRREGKGTQIDTLSGGESLGEIEDVVYFMKKLYKSLKVPQGRLQADNAFTGGRVNEITREEIRFFKFIQKLRSKFNFLFLDLMKKNLILKKIITPAEWQKIAEVLSFEWSSDNVFYEMRNLEILGERVSALDAMTDHVGKYYSKAWVRKNILMMTDEDIESMKKELEQEKKDEPEEDEDL